MKQALIFTRFERFWHGSQMLMIFALLASGFEIHGSYQLLGFKQAVMIHEITAWILIGLWVFALFWHLTTGQWRHYVPTSYQLNDVIRFYMVGIFKGENHPYRRKRWAKHNPLQRLAYLGLKMLLLPLIWGSGLFYMFYGLWMGTGAHQALPIIAGLHTAGAFLMLVFVIGHIYLTTTGETPTEHIKSMVTGYAEIEEDENEKE